MLGHLTASWALLQFQLSVIGAKHIARVHNSLTPTNLVTGPAWWSLAGYILGTARAYIQCGGLYHALSNPLLSQIHAGIDQQSESFNVRNNLESAFGPAQFITQLTHVLSVMEAVDASAILEFITH